MDFKKNELKYVASKVFEKTINDPSNKDKKFLRTNIRELTESEYITVCNVLLSLYDLTKDLRPWLA